MASIITLGNCTFEVLTRGEEFLGLGAVTIDGVKVRSGRLPVRPATQSFSGLELAALRVQDTLVLANEARVEMLAFFRPLAVKLMRDHSFDPIHDTRDWDVPAIAGTGRLTLVLRPAADDFDGLPCRGFSYHYEYQSDTVPLFYLLDQASWELEGNIAGATVISQSSCSTPVVTFAPDTAWTTEGVIHWEDTNSLANPVMTHNLPRWASHQAFDFQYKGDLTLLGVYAHVDLIRTLLKRDAGKAELKCLDKHLFDEALTVETTPKAILLNAAPKTAVDQRNLWTRVFDAVHDRARAEFGLAEEPLLPRIHCNYWDNFTIDDYRKDLLPAAAALGFTEVFIDNVNKSAMTADAPGAGWHWNMCCGHEYEPAPELGGPERLKAFVDDAAALGIRVVSWTNNDQALSSPMNHWYKPEQQPWYVRMEDTRLKFGGAYTNCMSILNFANDEARSYWVECLKTIKATTGLEAYLFDSFYNLGFMPIDYAGGKPTTQWRGTLQGMKALQDAGVHFLIESFGPFGVPMHGCPLAFAQPENLFTLYKVSAQLNYTTIPTTPTETIDDAAQLYRFFAHMATHIPHLFQHGKRLDQIWGDGHTRALADYHANRPFMKKRFLQEDGLGVLWLDAEATRATLWNFADRSLSLDGTVTDATTGDTLPATGTYALQACHTYVITGAALPVKVGAAAAV
jgi:hypothetical protein